MCTCEFLVSPWGACACVETPYVSVLAVVNDGVYLAATPQPQAHLIECPFLYRFHGFGIDMDQRKRVFNADRIPTIRAMTRSDGPITIAGVRI
jgi:hypothetical protein